jgi:6-phosphogluconate dehydrogenase
MGKTISNVVENLLVMDIGDILDDLQKELQRIGIRSVCEDWHKGPIESFLYEIFTEVGYLPDGERRVAYNVTDVLDTSGQYFDRGDMCSYERIQWMIAVQRLINRFVEYRLYGKDHVHVYDFFAYENNTLYLQHHADNHGD